MSRVFPSEAWRRVSYQWQLAAMLAPYALGLLVLVGLPVLLAAPVAFTQFDALSPPEPVGFANFAEFLQDSHFWDGLRASIILVVIAVPLRVAGALTLALLLQASGRGFTLLRGIAYLPTIIPDVAYALVWLYIFNPLYGPLNGLSQVFASGREVEFVPTGTVPGIWLSDPRAAQVAVIIMLLFTVGEGFVLLLAALQEIPRELFDAAALDGASGDQQLRHVTLPLLAPSLLLLTLRDIVFSFQASFVAAVIVTHGNPYYATSYLPFWIYRNAVEFGRLGYAAAMTWVLYGVTALIIGGLFWIARRWREVQYAG
ncbi:MAG TPA: sugar ABC transporter permease [Chloroflexia bacterium]|nr:sugar ABC transporter permease [Chloroflexia bacterium]